MKDTLDRDINIGDIVCHANTSRYSGCGANVGRVIGFSAQRVRIQYTYGDKGSVEPDRCAIMRSEDVVFNQ